MIFTVPVSSNGPGAGASVLIAACQSIAGWGVGVHDFQSKTIGCYIKG